MLEEFVNEENERKQKRGVRSENRGRKKKKGECRGVCVFKLYTWEKALSQGVCLLVRVCFMRTRLYKNFLCV